MMRVFSIGLLAAALGTALPSRANISFNLIPEAGTPQYAIDGFTTAAGLWSSMIADNVTVNIQIGFTSLSPGVLGEAGSAFGEASYSLTLDALQSHRTSSADYSSYAGLQTGSSYSRLINHTSDNPFGANSSTPYVTTMDRVGMTTANAKALGLLGASTNLDATIRFNSDFTFDFSHDDITAGQFDFVGIAAHEIGHALGFVSGVDDIDAAGGQYAADVFSSNLLDLYRYSALSLEAGAGFTDYTADGREKYFSIDGGNTALALFALGINYGDGRQASHWKDNLALGLMDPTVAPGERMDFSTNDWTAIDVLGFTLVPEPGTGSLMIGGLALMVYARRHGRKS